MDKSHILKKQKMKGKKIYVIGHALDYANWIIDLGFEFTTNVEDSDLVMFTGGADVDPMYYGHPKDNSTNTNSARDAKEFLELSKALKQKKKLIGICRGSQFLCVGSGGKLIQDMNHPSAHSAKTVTGEIIQVTSSHHQMMYPFELDAKEYLVVATASSDLCSNYSYNGRQKNNVPADCEVVFFKETNALAIQSHPEWQFNKGDEVQHETVVYFQNLLTDFMNNQNVFHPSFKSKDIVEDTTKKSKEEQKKSRKSGYSDPWGSYKPVYAPVTNSHTKDFKPLTQVDVNTFFGEENVENDLAQENVENPQKNEPSVGLVDEYNDFDDEEMAVKKKYKAFVHDYGGDVTQSIHGVNLDKKEKNGEF
jgi:gamma-glutamyl-gamma-aminobutyrate hydrolase PuuD